MPTSISITNITNGTVLAPTFTVYGDFSLSMKPIDDGDITMYTIDTGDEPNQRGVMGSISVQCKLQDSAGADITVVPASVNSSGHTWQADFTGQAAGTNLKLVPVLTVDITTVTGRAITGLEIRADMRVVIDPPIPQPNPTNPPSARDQLTFTPKGAFNLRAADVRAFRSVIVIDGVEQADSVLSASKLRVNNASKTWEAMASHRYAVPVDSRASQVVRFEMANGEVLLLSRIMPAARNVGS